MNALRVRRRLAVFAAVAGLTLVGCSTGEDPGNGKPAASTSKKEPAGEEQVQNSQPAEEVEATLATARGQKGLELTLTSAERDAGGFLTVRGELTNTSDDTVVIPSVTAGQETEIVQHGDSFGGASIIDPAGKKRYYVLRDTDGRPLTTTGLSNLGPNKSAPIFLQFPAPPATTTEVSFQLPTFEPATLKLS